MLSSCASAPVVPNVVKIGLVAPFEGAYRSIGYDAIYAARLAIREINAISVSDGWAMELVAFDDRAETDFARTAARNLVTDPDVLAVIGHYTGGTTTAASEVYIEEELPLLVIGEGPESPTHWHTAPPPRQQAEEILKAITQSTTSAVVWGEGFLATELSQQLVAQEVQVLVTDMEIIPTSAATIFSTLPPLQTAEHLRVWAEQDWQGLLVGTTNLYADSFALVSGESRNRACFITPYPSPNDVAGIERWKKAYINVGPHVPEPGPYALPTYEMVYTLAEVIDGLYKEGKSLNRQQLNVALARAQRKGKLGTISWDEDGYRENAPLYLYCWKDTPGLVQRFP